MYATQILQQKEEGVMGINSVMPMQDVTEV